MSQTSTADHSTITYNITYRLWTGSPKYNSKPTNASASEGAVFACELSPRSQDGTDVSHECQKLHLSTTPPASYVNDTDGR